MAKKKKKKSSSKSSSSKKVKSIVTNTKGVRVTTYSDGSKSYSDGTSKSAPKQKEPTKDEKKQQEKADKETKKGGLSLDALLSDREFKALTSDQQEVVKAVYLAIGENNVESAQRLVGAFQAAEKLADPFFKQQIRVAKDAVERGFVEIDREAEFEEQQIATRLRDLQEDIAARANDLTIEESQQLKAIERDYRQTLDTSRQNLAASGLGSSSRRAETEQLIEETTGDMREGTRRKFAVARTEDQNRLLRGQRDTMAETQRLRELAKQRKTKLFRTAEEELGSGNLPSLNFDAAPLGNITGNINQRKQEDILGAVKNLVF